MNPALLVIDVQKGIDEAEYWGGERNNPGAEENIRLLLNFWREKKFPVFIIQHYSLNSDSPFNAGHDGNHLKSFAEPLPGETLIQKHTTSALNHTTLSAALEAQGIQRLFISGFVTNNSVESTARMAGDLGYQTTVIADATAAFNKKGIDGTVYSSELIHQISLSNLKDEFASIKSTRQVLEELTISF